MTKKRWDPSAAARRAQMQNPIPGPAGEAVAPRADAAGTDSSKSASSDEYVLVSVRDIKPAPWQSRVVFKDIDVLADSIRGDGQTEGVGIVEPLLVRRAASGKFELIDGERRWRAAKIIAGERPDGDYQVPVRIFDVSDRIAQLIGQAANNERDQPKPLETALCYARLRAELEAESDGRPVGVRKVAGIGWHRRSMAHTYLTVAESLTPEILRSAGILDENGHPSEELVTKLSLAALHNIAKLESPESRVEALRAAAERARGVKPGGRKPVPTAQPELSVTERLAQMRDGDGFSIRVRGPVRALAPEDARRLVAHEVTPAIIALVEQGRGGGADEGFLKEFGEDHTVLVVPREVEQLSAGQLLRLEADVSTLAKRVRRAARFRRRDASPA